MIDLISAASLAASLLGLSAKDLVPKIKRLTTDRSKSRSRRQRESVRHHMLVETLEAYYRRSLGAGGPPSEFRRYAVATDGRPRVMTSCVVKPGWVGLDVSLASIQCDLVNRPFPAPPSFESSHTAVELRERGGPGLGIYNPRVSEDRVAEYLALLADARIWDADLYRLLEAREFPSKLVFAVDRFQEYRYGVGLLMEELTLALMKANCDVARVLQDTARNLPLREYFMPGATRFEDYGSRVCAGGIEVTVAMARHQGDFVIPIQQRSGLVSENQGLLAIIPAAFHQPMVDAREEVSPVSSVFREIFEEFFKGEAIEKDVRHITTDWYFKKHPALRWLRSHRRDVTTMCTSFTLNLLAGNYDFGVLMVVHDPAFWHKFGGEIEHNWEASNLRKAMTGPNDLKSLGTMVAEASWADSPLVSLVEGLTRLRVLEPKRVADLSFRRELC